MSDTNEYIQPMDRPKGICQSFDNCSEVAEETGLCATHRARARAFWREATGEDLDA